MTKLLRNGGFVAMCLLAFVAWIGGLLLQFAPLNHPPAVMTFVASDTTD